jgi:hypothetical protein
VLSFKDFIEPFGLTLNWGRDESRFTDCMKRRGRIPLWALAGLVLWSSGHALTAGPSTPSTNPYQAIVDRNVFGLKPPPPPPDPEAAKPPPVKITLTGITTILGDKRVLMKTPPPAAKPGEAPKGEQSFILKEGQREGDIEVLEIDEKAASVKVNNGGTVVTLTLAKDGSKLAPGPVPVPVPSMPGAPPSMGLRPPMSPAPVPSAPNSPANPPPPLPMSPGPTATPGARFGGRHIPGPENADYSNVMPGLARP